MNKYYITQLIYLLEGQEQVFDEFENKAIPIISKYRGKLLLRVRPDHNSWIEHHIERPYEMHLVEFDSIEDFNQFMKDEERQSFLDLKEASIRSVWLIGGNRML